MESCLLQKSELKKFKKIFELIKNNVDIEEIMDEVVRLDLTEKETIFLNLLLDSINGDITEVMLKTLALTPEKKASNL